MRVLEIDKRWSTYSRTDWTEKYKKLYLTIYDDNMSDEGIKAMVEEACATDFKGCDSYYTYNYKFITDKETISKVLEIELTRLLNYRDEISKNIDTVMLEKRRLITDNISKELLN